MIEAPCGLTNDVGYGRRSFESSYGATDSSRPELRPWMILMSRCGWQRSTTAHRTDSTSCGSTSSSTAVTILGQLLSADITVNSACHTELLGVRTPPTSWKLMAQKCRALPQWWKATSLT